MFPCTSTPDSNEWSLLGSGNVGDQRSSSLVSEGVHVQAFGWATQGQLETFFQLSKDPPAGLPQQGLALFVGACSVPKPYQVFCSWLLRSRTGLWKAFWVWPANLLLVLPNFFHFPRMERIAPENFQCCI